MIDPKLARPIILVVIVGMALTAYVLHRRSRVKANEAKAPLSTTEQPGDRDSSGGMGGGDDGRGPGDNQRGPQEGEDYGAEEGPGDPEGRPGTMGPRSEPVCVLHEPSRGSLRFELSGQVGVDGAVRTGQDGITTIVATDTPIEEWAESGNVRVYGVAFTASESFELAFDHTERTVEICAFRTSDYQEFSYAHVGGCLPGGLEVPGEEQKVTRADLSLSMLQLQGAQELIGFNRLVTPELWPGTVERRIRGTVRSSGRVSARYLVSVADFPILENPESERNPSALAVTDGRGGFDLSMLAPEASSLFVCALGLPAPDVNISSLSHLYGMGCTEVSGDGSQPIELVVKGDESVELTTHEKEHFSFLAECLEGGRPEARSDTP